MNVVRAETINAFKIQLVLLNVTTKAVQVYLEEKIKKNNPASANSTPTNPNSVRDFLDAFYSKINNKSEDFLQNLIKQL